MFDDLDNINIADTILLKLKCVATHEADLINFYSPLLTQLNNCIAKLDLLLCGEILGCRLPP